MIENNLKLSFEYKKFFLFYVILNYIFGLVSYIFSIILNILMIYYPSFCEFEGNLRPLIYTIFAFSLISILLKMFLIIMNSVYYLSKGKYKHYLILVSVFNSIFDLFLYVLMIYEFWIYCFKQFFVFSHFNWMMLINLTTGIMNGYAFSNY